MHSFMSDSLWPHGLYPARPLCLWDFPGKITGVGCHFLLQGSFPMQGSDPSLLCLLHWQPHFFLPLSHTEKPCLIIRVSWKETTVSSFVCDYVAAEMPGQVRSANTLGLTSDAAVIWSPGNQHSLQVAGVLVTFQGLHGEASLVAGIGCGVCTPATLAASWPSS